jgi:hypothetical protein
MILYTDYAFDPFRSKYGSASQPGVRPLFGKIYVVRIKAVDLYIAG